MMMTRPIKFSLLPTSSPVAVFLLHLLEANPAFVRLQTMILSFTVNLCDPRILIWDVTSWKDRSDIYTTDPDLSDKINFRLFCVFLQCSQPCLVFLFSFECLRPCLVHRASSMLLLPADQNTGWSPLTYINTISQIFRKTYVFAFKDLSVFAIASIFEQHQFQACWHVSSFFQHQTWGESEDVLDDQDKQIKTQVEDV